MTELTLTQRQAIELFDKGFNIYPIPKKNVFCMRYDSVYFSSIHKSQVKEAFQGNCHIGVLTGPTSSGLVVLQMSSDETLNRYIQRAQNSNIPIWAIKERAGGQIWFRTDVNILHNPVTSSQSTDIQVRTVNLNTGTPRYTVAPPTNSRNQPIHWIPTQHNVLQKLSREDIKNLDLDEVIQFPTQPDRRMPKYETDIRRTAEEGWSAAWIEYLVNQAREKYVERARNRTYF